MNFDALIVYTCTVQNKSMETPSIPTPLYVHCSKYIDGNAINSYAAIRALFKIYRRKHHQFLRRYVRALFKTYRRKHHHVRRLNTCTVKNV